MKERTFLILKLISSHFLISIVLVCLAPFIKRDAYLFLLIVQTSLIILILTGYWEFAGLVFKILFCLLLEAGLAMGFIWKINNGTALPPALPLSIILTLIESYLIYLLIKILIVIFHKDRNAFEIEFPFRNGKYLVTDGGNSKTSRLMNYHYYSPVHKKKNTNRSMLFATDVVKIPMSTKNFMPIHNEDYPVFGEKLYSPMNGKVFKVVNDIDENIPYSGNYPYNTGNTVVIRNENYFYLLGHMQNGSITVKTGDDIKAGNLIGAAGNSGMSERPHLHMQMMVSETEDFWNGTGINITFRGRNLYKNRLIRV